jgi:hypothetical protein
MTDEVLRDRECPGRSAVGIPQYVTADPTQLLTGLVIELPPNHVVCLECGSSLREGQSITVYGARRAEHPQWDLRRWYCRSCAPTTIWTPTLGVMELLARAWLGTVALPETRTHRLCLTEVELLAYSPPREGGQP